MTFTNRMRRTFQATAASVLILTAGVAFAEEIPASQLAQARAALASIQATDQFDAILPQAADALKGELVQKDPNLEALISSTVDNEVLALAARRADLENEAARVYAKVFTEEELKAIADFYGTPAGKKLLKEGPIATRGLVDAANVWQAGIARDLATNVAGKLKAAAPAEVAPAVDPAAPADGTDAAAPADPAAPKKPKQ
jgi:uncharacterized protein